ncbi:MAG TPA: ABC transporter substrate-binding protein [Geminicoccaceae bacterium]|nr:ABC transporter substrate-binding protein [Geminicoccaceae bacterium]
MQKNKRGAAWLRAAIVGAALSSAALPAQAQSDDTQFFPLLVYRTGPYAANGAPFADGMLDYLKLINANGGVNGVMLSWNECETEYKTDVGVECYERLKSNGAVAAVSPLSTGITYALIEKTTADQNVLFSMGYGRTSAADGTVFPWVFNFPATYWSQATSIMEYVAEQEGGFDQLAGKKIGLIHLDHPYGREPIPTLQKLAEAYGFELLLYPVPTGSMTDQKSIWLDIRRVKPDWMLMWGWGAMNPTAIKEASLIRYPMDHFIGNWWSAAEPDLLGSGVPAEGYIGATFHDVGDAAPVFEQIREKVYDAGNGTAPESEIGQVLYNRGVVNAAYVVEAMNTAMQKYGNKVLTGEEIRWGFENLDITPERIEELGMTGLLPVTKVTCSNHEGLEPAVKLQRWDGQKWTIFTDWIPAMTDVVRPLVEADAEQYAKENGITPRDCTN